MKKKILLFIAMVAIFVCVFAISVSASVSTNYDKTEKVIVTLTNGTQECALYDEDGDALVWYTLDNGATVKSVKTKDLTITYSSDGKTLYHFYLDAEKTTCLQRTGDRTTNCIVVANLRDLTFTTLPNDGYKGLFDESKIVQYVYLPVTIEHIYCNHFQKATSLKICDFPEDARYTFDQANIFNGATALTEINLTGLINVKESAHFKGCSSLKKVIGFEKSTTTYIGQDMFHSSGITEITIPNTATSFGTGVFYGCKSLQTVRAGANLTSLGNYDAFKECPALTTIYLSGGVSTITTNTFHNTKNVAVIYYTGSYDQAKALKDSANQAGGNSNCNHIYNDYTLISSSEYETLADKSGKYIVYDYNACDAFYNGVHTLDPEKSNACAGVCKNCGDKSYSANPEHEFTTTIAYTDYCSVGIKTQTCLHEGCQYAEGTPYETEVPAIITSFQGISTKMNGDGLTIDYIVNYDALDEYSKTMKKTIELGFVVSVLGKTGNTPLANGVEGAVKAPVLTWTYDETNPDVNSEVVKYTGLSFRLEGNWDESVDLDGNGEKETSMKDIVFCMAGYIVDGETLSYINAGGTSDTADSNSYNGASTNE